MSIFSDILHDVASLLLPRVCPICGAELNDRHSTVCTMCELTAPLTEMWNDVDNPLTQCFWGLLPVCRASAFLWYVEGSPWRRAIHRFKYSGAWSVAYRLGRWYGRYLRQSGLYDDIDIVVPVPLHWWRQLRRGYNQSEYLARGIAEELGAKVDVRSVKRCRYNRSQTSRHKSERWENVEGIFKVKRPAALEGKHLLLVDDVFTSGATIMSLGGTILAASPTVRLSVAVLASSRKSLHQEQ